MAGTVHDVTFNVPSGAELLIDGLYGCLQDGKVVCDWPTLEGFLIDHTVSDLWWDLTETERRSIACMAIRNTMFFNIGDMRRGKANCGGGEGDWNIHANCCRNAYIRILKFRTSDYVGCDKCYWKKYRESDENEHCWKADSTYGLPCHEVKVEVGEKHNGGPVFGHDICGILIDKDMSIIDNWVFFQYGSCDIKPGDSQMPLIEGYSTYLEIWGELDFSTVDCNFINGRVIQDWVL